MASYIHIDEQVAISAFQAFQRHLWYLTEEMIPLCLFSPHISESIKSSVAKSILSSPKCEDFMRRMGTGFGKPIFPEVDITAVSTMELKDFLGSDCWKFFDITGTDSSFHHSGQLQKCNRKAAILTGKKRCCRKRC